MLSVSAAVAAVAVVEVVVVVGTVQVVGIFLAFDTVVAVVVVGTVQIVGIVVAVDTVVVVGVVGIVVAAVAVVVVVTSVAVEAAVCQPLSALFGDTERSPAPAPFCGVILSVGHEGGGGPGEGRRNYLHVAIYCHES